jgi:hypothetical protein
MKKFGQEKFLEFSNYQIEKISMALQDAKIILLLKYVKC